MRSPGEKDNIVKHPTKKTSSLRKKRKLNFKKSKLPVLVLILLLAYTVFSLSTSFDNLYALQKDVNQIQTEIDDLKDKNSKLKQKLENVNSDEYVEKMAREKLGMIKAGETKVVPVKNFPSESGNNP
ncbi:MAG: septum formation initiator family protein [Clostridiales bacterium]|nr:septum formation initiator family protein [Clostridiales bacterium]MCF8021582.1 septum formation initiator family protein [Clostridiales bacterium]